MGEVSETDGSVRGSIGNETCERQRRVSVTGFKPRVSPHDVDDRPHHSLAGFSEYVSLREPIEDIPAALRGGG